MESTSKNDCLILKNALKTLAQYDGCFPEVLPIKIQLLLRHTYGVLSTNCRVFVQTLKHDKHGAICQIDWSIRHPYFISVSIRAVSQTISLLVASICRVMTKQQRNKASYDVRSGKKARQPKHAVTHLHDLFATVRKHTRLIKLVAFQN